MTSKTLINAFFESFDIHIRRSTGDVKPGKRILSFSGWMWRPMMDLITDADELYHLGIPRLDTWHYNSGFGLSDRKSCELLADALEMMIRDKPKNQQVGLNYARKDQFTYDRDSAQAMDKRLNRPSAYTLDLKYVQEFINFLRQVDGFEIW